MALGLLVLFPQLPAFLGAAVDAPWSDLSPVTQMRWGAIAVGVTTIVVFVRTRSVFPKAPAPLVGLLAGTALHYALLARLDAEWPGELLIVTQNVDDLHERAGASRVLHMHGELKSAWCLACDGRIPWEETLIDGWLLPLLPTNWVSTPELGISAELPAAPMNTSSNEP